MKIRLAKEKEYNLAWRVAKELPEWFDKNGIINIRIDFNHNNVIVAEEKNKIVGFLCYTTECGVGKLIWMGVKKNVQRQGIGLKLLSFLEKELKKIKIKTIEVETLPDEVDYEPYKRTRAFYYKNGFKRIEYKKARFKGWDDQILLEKWI
jgi:N-acetylglutamate synthase-like GNAT family acetyltransferase